MRTGARLRHGPCCGPATTHPGDQATIHPGDHAIELVAVGRDRSPGLNAVTDPRGWLVVAPDGIDHRWHDGREDIADGIDEVAFIRQLIDDVARRAPVDLDRVFATGISNGAMMSGRLACEVSDRIAAVAQVAGTLGVATEAACRPSRPVSVLVVAGTADPWCRIPAGR